MHKYFVYLIIFNLLQNILIQAAQVINTPLGCRNVSIIMKLTKVDFKYIKLTLKCNMEESKSARALS